MKLRKHQSFFFVGLIGLLVLVFWVSIIPLAYQNTASSAGDQHNYLEIALRMTQLDKLTDGNRHFLYPLLLVPFASRDIAFFTTAKFVSMIIGGLGLGAIFLVSSRLVGWGGAFLVAVLMAVNPEFRYAASFVDVEVLITPLFFFAWYASIKTLNTFKSSDLWWATAAGLLAGFVYLAKGNGILLLPVLLFTLFLLEGFNAFRTWKVWVFILSFVLVALPLWIYNIIQYGNPLFNINTTHYMWLDSWEESFVYATENLPTFTIYLKTHSIAHMGERLWNGLILAAPQQWYNAVRLGGMPDTKLAGRIAVLIGFLLLGVFSRKVRQAWTKRRAPFLYTLVGITLFGLLFAWYHPISNASRFVMLWTPVFYTGIIWLIQSLLPNVKRKSYEAVLLVIGFILLTGMLVVNINHLPKLAKMAEHDRASNIISLAFMESLLQKTQVGDTFLLGPTHAQAGWLAYDRISLALPHTPANWPYLNSILIREDIEYILLDKEMFIRRQPLLRAYWTLSEAGLTAETMPPGWSLLEPSVHPCNPCLYKFDRQVFEPTVPRHIEYGSIVVMTGFSLGPVTSDQPFYLTTNWELISNLDETIHVFVHVVDQNGEIVAQHDGPLVDDLQYYSEQSLPTGSIIRLEHPLPALPKGDYSVHVGLYRWQTKERIPVTEADVNITGDYPLLLPLYVK